jgi:hypothetical protein
MMFCRIGGKCRRFSAREEEISRLTEHVVTQGLPFCDRNEASEAIVNVFRRRMMELHQLNRVNAVKKECNPLTAIPGVPGSGKSTLLAHLPFSEAYKTYWKERSEISVPATLRVSTDHPLISIFTFNQGMGNKEVASGLRILFGTLRCSGLEDRQWLEFSEYYGADKGVKELNCKSAVDMLRRYFGKERLVLIAVDEIKKAGQDFTEMGKQEKLQKVFVSELGAVLDHDRRTDVVASSLTVDYIHNLVTKESNRGAEYVPIVPLWSHELDKQFREISRPYRMKLEERFLEEELANGLQVVNLTRAQANARAYDIDFRGRIFDNMHLLASGHPRTIEKLIKGMSFDTLLNAKELFHHRTRPLDLITKMSKSKVFKTYIGTPNSNKERELILSVGRKDVIYDETFRMMLEEARCFIFEKGGGRCYRLATSVSSFLLMLDRIKDESAAALSPRSRIAQILFGDTSTRPKLSDMWEQCCAMSAVSRVLEARTGFVFPEDFGTACEVIIPKDLNVEIATTSKDFAWKKDTLFLAPPNQSGFDFVTCLAGKNNVGCVFIYQEVKVCRPGRDMNKMESVAETLANKLVLTLSEHAKVNLCSEFVNLDAKRHLARVFFILSMYGVELGDQSPGLENRHALKQAVIDVLHDKERKASSALMSGVVGDGYDNEQARIKLHKYRLAIDFVNEFWDHIAFQGTEKMRATLIPTVVPIAQLVQEVDTDEEPEQ